MRKLAVPLIAFLALALLIGTIAYVVSAQTPATLALPISASIPTATPALTPEPAVLPDPTPTVVPAATPTLTPSPTLPPAMGAEPTGGNIAVHYGEQPPYALTGAGYDTVRLVNNETATDPTWQQLESFLLADKTDEKAYVTGAFMCGAFAEEVHNNAEAAGIKAAWVSLSLEGASEGHALNAFYTTDRGLVYVDCSGQIAQNSTQSVGMNSILLGDTVYGESGSWDKVAYVAVGKELGLVCLNVASCPQYVCYDDYEQRKASFEAALNDYNQKARDYNSEVTAFNEWVAGEAFVEGTSDAARAHQWEEELTQERDSLTTLAATLDEEGKSLGAFWQTPGIVSGVDIYW